MNEQAACLRAPRGAARLRAPLVAVTGGKGGVGKTTLCANLALALHRAGLRALALDLDFGLANLNVAFGIELRRHVEDFFDADEPLASCVVRDASGVELLPAGSGTADMARPDHARRQGYLAGLTELSGEYDVLVADTAAGIGADVLSFCALADRTLLVTNPDPAALTDAYGCLKALDTWASERGMPLTTPELVVNHVADADQARAVAGRISRVAERFLDRSPRLAAWIPEQVDVTRATARQRPFLELFPRGFATRAVERLAADCVRQLGLTA